MMEVFEFRSDGRSGDLLVDSDIFVEIRGFECQKIGECERFAKLAVLRRK